MSRAPYAALVEQLRADGDRLRASRGLPPLRRASASASGYVLEHLTDGWRLTIPGLQIVSEANHREHHFVRAKRVREQRGLLQLALAVTRAPRLTGPLHCTFTRLGVRGEGIRDRDNLTGSAKHVADQLAEFLGVDDSAKGPVRWHVAQEPGGEVGLRVELRRRVPHAPSCAQDIDPARPCSCGGAP